MTKVETVYNHLWEGIVLGDIPEGTRLVIRDIANKMQVSDIPVREALQRLQADGFVKITPYVGAVVTAVSPDDLEEVLAIRGALEPLAASLSAPLLTDNDIEHMRNLLRSMERAAASGDYRRYAVLNRGFHTTMYSRCPYKMLLGMLSDLWNRSERARSVFKTNPESLLDSLKEHYQMLAVIEERDYAGLERVLRQQRERVKSAFEPALSQKTGYDSDPLAQSG